MGKIHLGDEGLTPGEFARSLLDTEAIAQRYRGEEPEDEIVLAADFEYSEDSGIGGWPEYSPEHVVSSTPLKETAYSGRRAEAMAIQTLDQSLSHSEAFVTRYPPEESGAGPNIRQGQSQMSVWAFCDAVGIDVPRHHWVPNERAVVVESVGPADEDTSTVLTLDDPVYADRINPSQIRDLMSVQLLAGVEDITQRNLIIDERGLAYVFDFDKADQRYSSVEALRVACNKSCKTLEILDSIRSEPLGLARSSLCTRTCEIASAINNSSQKERILETVARYDEIFEPETGETFESLFRNNLSVLSS